MKYRSLSLFAGAVTSLMLLSACGAGDDADGGEAANDSSGEQLTVSTETQFPPMGFIEDGELVGFNVDLGEALADEMGVEIKWNESEFSQFMTDVTTDRADLVLAGMLDNEERQESVTFVDFLETGFQFFTTAEIAEEHGIEEIEDFCGKSVAASRNSTYAEDIKEWSDENCGDEEISVLDTDGSPDAQLQLKQGRVEGVMQTSETISYMSSQDEEIQPIGEPITSSYYGMFVDKDDEELANRLADALENLIADGTYQEVAENWGLSNELVDEVTINLESR